MRKTDNPRVASPTYTCQPLHRLASGRCCSQNNPVMRSPNFSNLSSLVDTRARLISIMITRGLLFLIVSLLILRWFNSKHGQEEDRSNLKVRKFFIEKNFTINENLVKVMGRLSHRLRG